MKYIKNGEIIQSGTPIVIGDKRVYNPTPQIYIENGWVVYTEPEPEPYIPTYKESTVALIRQRYDADDELAILRQKGEKPEEFAEYFSYVESCKLEAKNGVTLAI